MFETHKHAVARAKCSNLSFWHWSTSETDDRCTENSQAWTQKAENTCLLRIFHPVTVCTSWAPRITSVPGSHVTARGDHLDAWPLAYWQDDLLETSDQSQWTSLLKSTNMVLQRQACMLVWNAPLLVRPKTVVYQKHCTEETVIKPLMREDERRNSVSLQFII